MNSENLKKILKPLIKQCVKEVIFEEGALSKIIQEVTIGLTSSQSLIENKDKEDKQRKIEETNKRLEEKKKNLLNSIGADAYNNINIFENTTPLSSGGTTSPNTSAASPLSNIDPNDPGVDISGLFGNLSENWKKMV
tara:strand:+ start:441 stop:851 length:411 start_codon:yes stop_codon:yes gene_type:complete